MNVGVTCFVIAGLQISHWYNSGPFIWFQSANFIEISVRWCSSRYMLFSTRSHPISWHISDTFNCVYLCISIQVLLLLVHSIMLQTRRWQCSRLYGNFRYIIASKMGCIDKEPFNCCWSRQSYDTPIMTSWSLPSRLPSIHPLPILLVPKITIWIEHSLIIIEAVVGIWMKLRQAFAVGKDEQIISTQFRDKTNSYCLQIVPSPLYSL